MSEIVNFPPLKKMTVFFWAKWAYNETNGHKCSEAPVEKERQYKNAKIPSHLLQPAKIAVYDSRPEVAKILIVSEVFANTHSLLVFFVDIWTREPVLQVIISSNFANCVFQVWMLSLGEVSWHQAISRWRGAFIPSFCEGIFRTACKSVTYSVICKLKVNILSTYINITYCLLAIRSLSYKRHIITLPENASVLLELFWYMSFVKNTQKVNLLGLLHENSPVFYPYDLQ